jgi:hypothetical protein
VAVLELLLLSPANMQFVTATLVLACLFLTQASAFEYELLRRLSSGNGTVVYAGVDGGTVITTNCTSDSQCGKTAICKSKECICNSTYYTLSSSQAASEDLEAYQKNICGYQQISKSFAIVVSVLFGGCGVDRCLLARYNGCGICIGITKGLTIGACEFIYAPYRCAAPAVFFLPCHSFSHNIHSFFCCFTFFLPFCLLNRLQVVFGMF